MYGLQGFFFENCTDCTNFFENFTDLKKNVRICSKKMYGLYGFFSENCRDCTDFSLKNCTDCTDFFRKCTDFFKKVLATLLICLQHEVDFSFIKLY